MQKRPISPASKTPRKLRTDNTDLELEDIEVATFHMDTGAYDKTSQEILEDIEREVHETINNAFHILNQLALANTFFIFSLNFREQISFLIDNISILLFEECTFLSLRKYTSHAIFRRDKTYLEI